MDASIASLIGFGILATALVSGGAVAGWIHLTRLKIRNGYPLENMWGKPMHPQVTSQAQERIALLTRENASLQAELSALKDRVQTVERIVTDKGFDVATQIEALRGPRGFDTLPPGQRDRDNQAN